MSRSEHDEGEVSGRWWSLPRNILLPLSQGGFCRVLFPGYPGGPAGPDVQDALLQFSEVSARWWMRDVLSGLPAMSEHERLVGAVEFHVHAHEWRQHQHHLDPRYNIVLLHVVLTCDDAVPTVRQDGTIVPVCSLSDLSVALNEMLDPARLWQVPSWPCQVLLQHLADEERDKLLFHAGIFRFEEKTQRFVEQLHALDLTSPVGSDNLSDPYDHCFIPALAEGLGYGRDRAMFRAIGLYLIGKTWTLPAPVGWSQEPAPLDALRLQVLIRLIDDWYTSPQTGLWRAFCQLLETPPPVSGAQEGMQPCLDTFNLNDQDLDRQNLRASNLKVICDLRTLFCQIGLSVGRADILICNVVLPFAAAIALIEQRPQLGERAQYLYRIHPGLPSNRITRMMCAQLRLLEEPKGSCRQQGLHYIYQQTCQAKRCELCVMSKQDV